MLCPLHMFTRDDNAGYRSLNSTTAEDLSSQSSVCTQNALRYHLWKTRSREILIRTRCRYTSTWIASWSTASSIISHLVCDPGCARAGRGWVPSHLSPLGRQQMPSGRVSVQIPGDSRSSHFTSHISLVMVHSGTRDFPTGVY